MAFGNDALLFYNVGDFAKFGLAVPNCGNDRTSQNDTIRYLTETVGRNLQGIMWHTDASLRTPPSINTLMRIHKLCIRARQILAGRAVPANVPNMEPQHALPAPETFLVFPTPYFTVRNTFLKQYSGLVLTALTEAFQHSENRKPIEISETFAGHFGQYIHRVYRLMATELFNVPAAEAAALDFTLTEAQIKAYNPAAWFTQTEMIDTVAPIEDWPTEDDLQLLTDGIPVTVLPTLGRWPTGSPGGMGASASAGSSSAGTTGSAFLPAANA